jgi:hypothetical protein
VILLALGSDEKGDYAADKANPVWQNTYLAPMKHLLGLGIPIVCAAGNNVPFQENRKKIDSRPQLFQDSTFPIINVGAADFQGKRLSMSRYNDEPMIYAPGDRVQAQSRDGGALSITPSGTSIGKWDCSAFFLQTDHIGPDSHPHSCTPGRGPHRYLPFSRLREEKLGWA